MSESQRLDRLLQSTADLGRRLFTAAACSLALLEEDEEHLLFRAASGAGADEIVGLRLPVSRGIAGWVASSGQPIGLHDVRADSRFARDVAESTGYVPSSILAMPINTPQETIGVIELLDRTTAPGRDDTELLALLAQQVAWAVELAGAAQVSAAEPDATEVLARLTTMGAAEQRAAAALLAQFVAYVGRRGGPAGLV